MSNKDYAIGIVFLLIAIFSRYPLAEKYQSSMDGPQYSIGVVRYSLEQQTPAPPGYPLYTAIGRGIYVFTNDPFRALVLESVLFSGLGAFAFFLAGKQIFNRKTGIIASFLFLSGPTFYFFGLTAYPYGLLPAVTTLLGLCVWMISVKKSRLGILLGCIFSLAIGVRPQETLFFLPLFIFGVYHLPNKERLKAFIVFGILTCIWLIPFMYVVGGVEKYISETASFLKKGALPSLSFANTTVYFVRVIKGFFLSFTISLLFLIIFISRALVRIKKKEEVIKIFKYKTLQVFLLWILPSLTSCLFIRNDNAAYQMTFLSGFVLLISNSIWRFFSKKNKSLIVVVVILACFNLWWFFRSRDPQLLHPYIPTSFHYSEIRKNDLRLSSKLYFIQKYFDPRSSVVITSAQPWRSLMYYLKEYEVEDLEKVFTKDKEFKDITRIGYHWSFREQNQTKSIYIVPKHITWLIFTDEGMYQYIYGKEKRTIKLKGNADISVLRVRPGEKIAYSFMCFGSTKCYH